MRCDVLLASLGEIMDDLGVERDESLSRLETIGHLRARLVDVMPDVETIWDWRGGGDSFMFRGHLVVDSAKAYSLVRARFGEVGYTPLFRRQGDYDLVIAVRYVAQPQADRWVVNLVLLMLTVVTTTLMGMLMEQGDRLLNDPTLVLREPWIVFSGVPASLTIMSILGIHELAHYFAARRHGLETSLPYFIPVPFGFGTFGAIIRIRTPWESRKALFDVGLAGPLAGIVVALPIFFFGLLISPASPPLPDGMPLGSPLLLRWMEDLVYRIRGIPADYDIYVNAMTFAAWFGLVVTGFNLLPVGQLDGGHVAYALLGRWSRAVGGAVLVALLLLGWRAWSGWYVWAAFILFSGWQHPAPLNALEPLGLKRTVIGVLAFVLAAFLFTPAPFPR